MPNRKETMLKIAKLSGRFALGGFTLAVHGAEAMNGVATDFLGVSNSLAGQFSGSSNFDIGPKVYGKASKVAFTKTLEMTKWADKKLRA
ncbi:MAG: hypothetical protein ACK5N8_05675 [Alphaproteobacteria bacterium]